MRLIRAGKVIATDEKPPQAFDYHAGAAPLPKEMSRLMGEHFASNARTAREHAAIEAEIAQKVTFKHNEPKHLLSPAGRAMTRFEGPKARVSSRRIGHNGSDKLTIPQRKTFAGAYKGHLKPY